MFRNEIIEGDAAHVLREMPAGSVNLVVTDPPYLVNYRDRDGRNLKNDANAEGVMLVFAPMARAMKHNSYEVCFQAKSLLSGKFWQEQQ